MNATNSVLVVTQLIVIPYDTMQMRWMMCFLSISMRFCSVYYRKRTIWSSDMHKRLWKVCLDDLVSVRPKRSVEWEREGLGRGLRSLLLLSVDCTHISTRSCWNLCPFCCIHAIIS